MINSEMLYCIAFPGNKYVLIAILLFFLKAKGVKGLISSGTKRVLTALHPH